MAGLAAEKFKFQEMTTGAAGDLRFATQLARRLVTQYGMSDKIGPVSLESENNDLIYPWEEYRSSYSDDTLRQIDEEVARLLKTAYNKAVEMIEKNQAKLDLIANKLLEQESIEKEEFERLMKEE
jgi:cell division protease FtsH